MITLTMSEQAIYDLIVKQGMRTKDIAVRLGYTSRTLESKISIILQKKGVTTQKELIIQYYTEIIMEYKKLCLNMINL